MPLDFLVALGTTIGYNVTVPLPNSPTYTLMAKIIGIDGLGVTIDDIEGGLLASRVTPSRPGAIKGDRFTLNCQFDSADAAGFVFAQTQVNQAGGPNTINWQIIWEDGSKTTFMGYIGGMQFKDISRDGRLNYDIPVKLTSLLNTTPAT